jgi:iron(III) transport system substrate-binding protein
MGASAGRLSSPLAALLGAACACARAPELPEVRVHAAADLPFAAIESAAGWARRARAMPSPRLEDAELAWLSDPAAALALGGRAVPGSAPEAAGVPPRFADPRGRFAPLGARARVLLVRSGARLPFEPTSLRHLADRRMGRRIALAPLGRGSGPVTAAALGIAHGSLVLDRWIAGVAANGPLLAEDDAGVRALLASGEADVGLAGSTEAAAAAASAAGLRAVYPDQGGRGAVVLPTALVVLPGAGDAARALAEWLAGPEGERLLVARVPGLLPLRADVPVPPGVEPAQNLHAIALDWDALAAEAEAQAARLGSWPVGFTEGVGPTR